MIRYVQSVASQDVPPPYHFPGVTVNAFVWEAQMAPIQAYCDRYLNLGSAAERGFVYRPAAFLPYAMLLFIDYPVMISSAKHENIGDEVPYSLRGIISQQEVFVAVPLLRHGATADTLVSRSALEWALPFIVVGNPMSSICGREMIGLGKLLANIRLGEARFPDSFRGRVSLPGWKDLEPGTLQEMLPFLEVETAPVLPTFRGSPATSTPWSLFQSREGSWLMDSLMTLNDFVDASSSGLVPTAMRTVGLKQFRDAGDPTKAVYQALVTCRSNYADVSNFRFYNENDVKISVHDTGSFGEILRVFLELPDGPGGPGQPTGQTFTFEPKAAYQFNANIDFDEMRTIYTWPCDRGAGAPPVERTADLTANWLRPWRGFFGPRRAP